MSENLMFLLIVAVLIAVMILFFWLLLKLIHLIFARMQKKRNKLHLVFFERLITAAIIIYAVMIVLSALTDAADIWKTLLGSTAFMTAVGAFAAKDSLKDILSGLMISIYKPFEIGNRIEMENGTAGVVKDITMRHIVLQGVDSQTIIVPNSILNSMKVVNYSYHTHMRSAQFTFHISYDSDVELALEVIRNAIMESEHAVPGKKTENGKEYGPVYFMGFEDSSFRLVTTVFYEPSSPTEVMKSDINRRVTRALKENGIEIPYTYINVIEHQGSDEEMSAAGGQNHD